MHPQGEVGVGRAVAGAAGHSPDRHAELPVDAGVHRANPMSRRGRLIPIPERDLQHCLERASEPGERVLSKVAVVHHPGRHQGVGDLQQERRAPAQKQGSLPPDMPGRALGPIDSRVRSPAHRGDRQHGLHLPPPAENGRLLPSHAVECRDGRDTRRVLQGVVRHRR